MAGRSAPSAAAKLLCGERSSAGSGYFYVGPTLHSTDGTVITRNQRARHWRCALAAYSSAGGGGCWAFCIIRRRVAILKFHFQQPLSLGK